MGENGILFVELTVLKYGIYTRHVGHIAEYLTLFTHVRHVIRKEVVAGL